MSCIRIWLAATAITAVSGTALANSTANFFVPSSEDSINIASGEFANILTGPGEHFSAADMATVNEAIQQDISTQGYISILLAETGSGLSILTMFDGVEILGKPDLTSTVTSTAFVPTTATWQYNIDAGGTFSAYPFHDEMMLNGAFNWESGVNSEAMAVSNLEMDDQGNFFLNAFEMGNLSNNQTIQLLTMEGGAWSVAHSFEFEEGANQDDPGTFYTEFKITNIPAPGGLLLIALAIPLGQRRRQR